MKLRELESRLSNLNDFERPKIELEQYMTRPHIAAQILNFASEEFNDIEDSHVIDLGCGGGALTAAALYCGAGAVTGVEIDSDAVEVNLSNRELPDFEDCQWDVVQADVRSLKEIGWLSADVVITNPPFGTKNNEGIDVEFLMAAKNIARESIYSLHKSSCRSGLTRKVKKIGLEGEGSFKINF